MENSRAMAEAFLPPSLHELKLQIHRAGLLTVLVIGMLLVISMLYVIGMLYLSNPDGLTEEEQRLVGKVGVAFLWLAGFAIGIYTFFNNSGRQFERYFTFRLLGVGYFVLTIFTIGIGIYLNNEE